MITRRSVLAAFFPPIFLPWLSVTTAPTANTPPQQWEYKLEAIQDTKGWPEVLNKRGSEGWQLCSRTDRPGAIEFIWRRPL